MRVLIIAALFFVSCSAKVSKQTSVQEKPPVEVEVPQAFNQQGRLRVRVSVRPLVNLRSEEVVVGVVGIGLGEPVEQYFTLQELSQKAVVNAGEVLLADFDLPSVDLAEYQVICKWGDDGKGVRTERDPPPVAPDRVVDLSLQNLALRRVNGPCPPCDQVCIFEGDLVNGFTTPVSEIRLALGVIFVPTGGQITNPDPGAGLLPDEEEVPLPDLIIPPGESKAIEIKVPQPLAEIPEGQFVPYLRLLTHR